MTRKETWEIVKRGLYEVVEFRARGGPTKRGAPTREAVAYARSLEVPHMRAAELAHKKYPKVKYDTIYNELRRAKPKG
jgi:hypothetical protein